MQTRKISLTKLTFAFVTFLLVASFCFVLPTMTTSEKVKLSAATNSVTVTFTGFPTNGSVNPFCSIRFLKSDGTTYNAMLTDDGSFNLSGAAGKLEITVPMYSKVTGTGLPTPIQNNCTYYVDITTSTDLTALTVTYTDQGYFSSTTII